MITFYGSNEKMCVLWCFVEPLECLVCLKFSDNFDGAFGVVLKYVVYALKYESDINLDIFIQIFLVSCRLCCFTVKI